MHDKVHRRLRDSVRRGDYVMTLHAEEEMSGDRLTVFDMESAILTGKIVQRQRDADTREWKYVIRGRSLMGSPLCVVVKLSKTRVLVIITVYSVGPTNGRHR